MSLLMPDTGLLFWMSLSFTIVLLVLAKFAFPSIIATIDERKAYIDQSIRQADETNRRLDSLREERDEIVRQAKEERTRILNEALAEKTQIIDEAKAMAKEEAGRQLELMRLQIAQEREENVRQMQKMAVELAVKMSEKIMRKQFDSEIVQKEWIDDLLDQEKG